MRFAYRPSPWVTYKLQAVAGSPPFIVVLILSQSINIISSLYITFISSALLPFSQVIFPSFAARFHSSLQFPSLDQPFSLRISHFRKPRIK